MRINDEYVNFLAAVPRLPRQLSADGTSLVQYSPETSNTQASPTQQLLVSTQQVRISGVCVVIGRQLYGLIRVVTLGGVR